MTPVDFETEDRLFGLKNGLGRIGDFIRKYALYPPIAGGRMGVDMAESSLQGTLDQAIIMRRQYEQSGSLLQTSYVGMAMPLANLTGVKDASYFYDGTDPVTGRRLSSVERGLYGTLGSVQLVTIASGGMRLIAPKITAPTPMSMTGNQMQTASVEQILAKQGASISDDALVHFSNEVYLTIKPSTPGGNSYWFKYGDIKNMTPEHVRSAIGEGAQSGLPGGTNVIHVYQTKNVPFYRTKPTSGFNIDEWLTPTPNVIVEPYPLIPR